MFSQYQVTDSIEVSFGIVGVQNCAIFFTAKEYSAMTHFDLFIFLVPYYRATLFSI